MRQRVRVLGVAAASLLLAVCRSTPPDPTAHELASKLGLVPRAAAASDGVPVRVIDAKSGRPVADALVVAVDEYEFTYSNAMKYDGPAGTAKLLRENGAAYVTASDGTTRVAFPQNGPQFVFAWRERDFGRVALEVHDRTEQLIEVGPRDLEVVVVDHEGRPQADVPIQLAKCVFEADIAASDCAITDMKGRCTVPALERARGVHRTCGYRDLVLVGALVSGGEIRPLDAAAPQPVRFVLPECGEVVVEVQDADGRPFVPDASQRDRWTLDVEAFPRDRGAFRFARVPWARSVEFPLDGTPLRLRWVELGCVLEFRLDVESVEGEVTHTSEAEWHLVSRDSAGDERWDFGPTKAGETRHVVLRLDRQEEDEESNESVEPAKESVEEALDVAEPATTDTTESNDPSSSVAIAVRTDVPLDACTLRVRLDDSTQANEHNQNPWIDVTGHATMRLVPPGTYSIAIVLSSFDRDRPEHEVWRMEEVEVPRGQHLRDPRLLAIDLRGKLRRSSIDVVDPEGRPLAGELRLVRGDPEEAPETILFDDGHCDLLTASDDACRVVVAVDRFRPVELASPPTKARLVMQRGFPIRVELDPRARRPDGEGGTLVVGISELPQLGGVSGGLNQVSEPRTVVLEPGRPALFDIPEPGPRTLQLYFQSRDNYGMEELTSVPVFEPTIEVEARADEQRFVVAPWDWMGSVLEQDAGTDRESPSSPDDE